MSVLDQAQNVRGVVSAARQRERWEQQMAKTSDEERREQLREAIADLEARFPEIEEVPPGGAEAFARERGHGKGARSPVHEGRRRPAAGKRAATAQSGGQASPKRARSAGGSSRPARARARRLSGLPTGEQAWRQTGIPGAVTSGTSLTMSILGALVGLSLLFLVLRSAGEKNDALPQLLGTVTGFLERFVSTRDILPQSKYSAGPAITPREVRRLRVGEMTPGAIAALPELPPLPKVRGQRVTPNPNLGWEVRKVLPKVLDQR